MRRVSAAPPLDLEVPVQVIDDVGKARQITDALLRKSEASEKKLLVAMDLEGRSIGPQSGRIAIVQLCVPLDNMCYLFHISHMVDASGAGATEDTVFDVTGLRGVIESEKIMKLWFDVRTDTAALFHRTVRPAGVIDLQVWVNMKLRSEAMRPRNFLMGLSKCLAQYRLQPQSDTIKDEGLRLFAPEHGGSYDVFFASPLNPILVSYCSHDVVSLLALFQTIRQEAPEMLSKVMEVSVTRVNKSYNGHFTRSQSNALFDF
mmetsp:Transcript_16736/g.19175  ORF Transcript_16736/g.19175 Transcript_16736/m.19175 type:complete len:260 (+) Transcript_16736:49-828(+)|eukprot:CAMPEP_0176428428 /NCGR_PEP_ID=MMETSP0127-20121128/13144_1 /TAXON_ID=938130 /ORGANISM="Platyophrya macrostoma, Strain WH" /LENGTH=259 /DNA_ID=CAMNT_0017810109 /DNA_START=45 /DNA_END=824 /DNA_ORIENTATION=-